MVTSHMLISSQTITFASFRQQGRGDYNGGGEITTGEGDYNGGGGIMLNLRSGKIFRTLKISRQNEDPQIKIKMIFEFNQRITSQPNTVYYKAIKFIQGS